jgi:hypothetical protein
MGANLSLVWPDRTNNIISAPDAFGELVLALMWLGSCYGIAMIFTTVKLIDRWRGPRDDNPTSLGSVLAAILLSVAWPVVLLALAFTNN